MNAPVLEALEARAGASDTDRPAWLAERATGCTATEVRELTLGNISDEELADLKLGRKVDSFTGNAYTAWGNEREPVIAAVVEQRWAIRPESRVFHAADNPRHLASPDGLGTDFDETLRASEIKTGGAHYDLAPWGVDYQKKGYGLQIQWVHHVTGAARTLYSWEERTGRPGSFRPGELRHEWVERDEAVIAALVERADRFLAVLDARAAEPFEAPEVDEVLDTHAVNYLRALDLEREAKALKAPAWAALLAAGKSQVSALARVTYKEPVAVEVEDIDYEAAKEANATLWARYQLAQEKVAAVEAEWTSHLQEFKSTHLVEGRPTLRVTAVKQKEQGNGNDED